MTFLCRARQNLISIIGKCNVLQEYKQQIEELGGAILLRDFK